VRRIWSGGMAAATMSGILDLRDLDFGRSATRSSVRGGRQTPRRHPVPCRRCDTFFLCQRDRWYRFQSIGQLITVTGSGDRTPAVSGATTVRALSVRGCPGSPEPKPQPPARQRPGRPQRAPRLWAPGELARRSGHTIVRVGSEYRVPGTDTDGAGSSGFRSPDLWYVDNRHRSLRLRSNRKADFGSAGAGSRSGSVLELLVDILFFLFSSSSSFFRNSSISLLNDVSLHRWILSFGSQSCPPGDGSGPVLGVRFPLSP